ncbi:MAG: hypothetical protein IJB26_00720 [Clostridia bacterium]|nr:hypothetical protein [Clostridia bacterium]
MQELDVRAIVGALLSKIKWILLSTVIVAALFGVYVKFCVPNTYKSEVQMYVSNINDLASSNGASASGLSASQVLVNEYIVILKNDAILSQVAAQLREQGDGYVMTNSAIRNSVKMSSVDETAMLNISVTTEDPDLSKAICDAFAAVAPVQLKEVMEMGTIKSMEPAKPGVKVGPNITKNVLIGAVIGFALACVIVLVLYMMDNTVTGERELKRRLNVTVLGEVPSLLPKQKGEKKNGTGK